MNETPLPDPAHHDTVFWMVYVTKGTMPTVRHATLEEARAEAERLSLKHHTEAYVLRAVVKVKPVAQTTSTEL